MNRKLTVEIVDAVLARAISTRPIYSGQRMFQFWIMLTVTTKNLLPKESLKVSIFRWHNTTHNVIQLTSEVQTMHRHRI